LLPKSWNKQYLSFGAVDRSNLQKNNICVIYVIERWSNFISRRVRMHMPILFFELFILSELISLRIIWNWYNTSKFRCFRGCLSKRGFYKLNQSSTWWSLNLEKGILRKLKRVKNLKVQPALEEQKLLNVNQWLNN
jgi:hypothetical protein